MLLAAVECCLLQPSAACLRAACASGARLARSGRLSVTDRLFFFRGGCFSGGKGSAAFTSGMATATGEPSWMTFSAEKGVGYVTWCPAKGN